MTTAESECSFPIGTRGFETSNDPCQNIVDLSTMLNVAGCSGSGFAEHKDRQSLERIVSRGRSAAASR